MISHSPRERNLITKPKINNTNIIEVEKGRFAVHGNRGDFSWIEYGSRVPYWVESYKTCAKLSGKGPYAYLKY